MSEGGEENVKVAVRVRPFNKRELGCKAQLVIDMKGNTTVITNPNDPADKKTFTFDHSYWSFDGFKEDPNGYCAPDPSHANGSKFADQKRIFDDLGRGILKNAWEGYNSTLFAYGQTGSGKSFSVIGYGANKGIVPMFCEEMFKEINARQKANEPIQFEVKFSMLEIYNEVVRDLLDPSKTKKGLKIREHPKKGFYAEGLKSVLVTSYDEIQQRMDEGTVNRTVASTNMNATSSRAHTIVGITLTQKQRNGNGQETAKTSVINLVDLAGSERVDAAGSSGERLKEGAAINQSLSCLGNCIHALAEAASGKQTKVPFRDSALTKLLMNALGGNSKTVMIASISPADVNFEETMSTLRYADRAKQIRTKAVINEDPTEKLVRDLKQENERLKKMLQSGKIDPTQMNMLAGGKNLSEKELAEAKRKWEEEMRAHMLENEKELEEMKKSYEEKLKQAQRDKADPLLRMTDAERKSKPHLFNINMDPQLNGRIIHILNNGSNEIGNLKGKESDIVMIGPGMQEQHAVIVVDKATVAVKPVTQDARILINGAPVHSETQLRHNDRLVFGSTQFWLFQNPIEPGVNKKKFPEITYEFAQQEIAAKAGLKMDHNSSSKDLALLQEDLMELMPAVEEANSISTELDKRVKFEIVLVAPQIIGKENQRSEVLIKMKNLENGAEFVWPKEKFLSRLFLMKEMYQHYEDEDDEWDLPEDRDPFLESPDTEILIGTVRVFLQPLAYMVELKEQLEIMNLKGLQTGLMHVEIIPCNARGKEYTEADDMFVDSPDQLIGKNVYFLFKIIQCCGLPNKYKEIYCKYRFYLDQADTVTDKATTSCVNPDFNHAKLLSCTPATTQFVDYLSNGSITVQVFGKQNIRHSAAANHTGLTTRDLLRDDRKIFSRTAELMAGFQLNGRPVDPQKQSIIVELLLMKKTQARLQQKLDFVRKLVDRCDDLHHNRVSVNLIKNLLNSSSIEQAEKLLSRLPDDWDESDAKWSDGTSQSGRSSGSGVCTLF